MGTTYSTAKPLNSAMGNVCFSPMLNEPFPGFVATVEVGIRKETSFRRIREWNLLEFVSFPLSLALLFLPSRFHCCITHSGEGDAFMASLPVGERGWESGSVKLA